MSKSLSAAARSSMNSKGSITLELKFGSCLYYLQNGTLVRSYLNWPHLNDFSADQEKIYLVNDAGT